MKCENNKMSTIVNFYEDIDISNELLIFAVIAATYRDKWVFCRHKERNTWEMPAGHREIGEDIAETASRELTEETGAVEFNITPVCVYSVTKDGQTTYGKLFLAVITEIGDLPPEMEIAEITLRDTLPPNLTYPVIQPQLFERARKMKKQQGEKTNN